MNFLLPRLNQAAMVEQPSARESQAQANHALKPVTASGSVIAEDPLSQSTVDENHVGYSDEYGRKSGSNAGLGGKNEPQIVDTHVDVLGDEGWITIPCKELPDNWREAPDIHFFRSMDRFFVFPGEQIQILACLSACKQDTEIITPFKVSAVMKKNVIVRSTENQSHSTREKLDPVYQRVDAVSNGGDTDNNRNSQNDVSSSESLLRMEAHRRQAERSLQRFSDSHFFVQIAESDEPLWSNRRAPEAPSDTSGMMEQKFSTDSSDKKKNARSKNTLSAVVDRGTLSSSTSGGIARDGANCYALPNGDIVVLLKINVGVDFLKDPVLEILQFEKYRDRNLALKNHEGLLFEALDPCGELLRWLLPLDNIAPPPPPLSPPSMSSSPNQGISSFGSSSSQLFSFGHFKSYSMSSPTPKTALTSTGVAPSSRKSSDLEDWNHFSFEKSVKIEKSGREGLLSFRGASLEPERFSVRCGLEGIYTPGRRWRRKIEIIQPVEINSFAVDCNTDDLLCIRIKNISPASIPNIVVYIDAITIVSEDASKHGLPSSFPISCIEAGKEHSLPNLALRRGEEHSFILKPAISLWKNGKGQRGGGPQFPHLESSSHNEGKHDASSADLYAVLVSCRCNYAASRLFFKQPINWRPRISRDLLISVAAEMSRQTVESNKSVAQLPVQVLTLQASNLTSEDLTLTVQAPASFTCPPSIVSLSFLPSSSLSPYVSSSEFIDRTRSNRQSINVQRSSSASTNGGLKGEGRSQSVVSSQQAITVSDILPSGDLGSRHLWFQSKVPLGCVPSLSMATIKLEVLPLTEGIITLESLRVDVKEKGITYIPEHPLKINATSSISSGVI